MDPMVLLRHDTPDNRLHFDWMLARPNDDSGGLLTFRADSRVDRVLEPGERLTRLPDHRRMYLDYEGPITNNRGMVTRIARGGCRIRTESPERITLECEWEASAQHRHLIEIDRDADPRWIVRSVTPTDTERR